MDIPKQFRPIDDPENYHQHCRVCEAELLASGRLYCVERVVKKPWGDHPDQVLFDFAVCLKCMDDLRKEMSQESQRALLQYQEEMARRKTGDEEELWQDFRAERCHFSGEIPRPGETFQMIAFCQGNALFPGQVPLLVGNKAQAEVEALLSPETKDAFDDFLGNHFGWPPEWAALLRQGKVIL